MTKKVPNPVQKELTKAINTAINNNFVVNKNADESLLQESNFNWDDLTKLKEELGKHVIQFMAQVSELLTNPSVIRSLKDKTKQFDKLIAVFFSDINEFSGKIKTLRTEHESKNGPVIDIAEFDAYNRISIMYQSYFTELHSLVTPTLSELLFLVSECIPNDTSNIVNSSVNTVTDVTPKEQKNEQ